ncbi:MAG: glyoxalase [Deltaproteobacteria bacterium]|nr:glyoxalase [Deltaproteobacteria bacterium]
MIPFHLAFPVHDLEQTRYFYGTILQCTEGRSAPRWIDFDFFGHQLSAHLVDIEPSHTQTNKVDGDAVPTRHFGAIIPWEQWENLHNRCSEMGVRFRITPKIRFQGKEGEQGTFFIDDPSGNVLEFKTFRNNEQIFARQ